MNAAPVTRRFRLAHEWAVHHWAGREPACVLVHATGFHGRCWDRVVRGLGGRACFAVDLPGHGRSGSWPPPYDWQDVGDELTELLAGLPLCGALGVGHSIGGFLLTWAAAGRRGLFGRLVLLDPVICQPQDLAHSWNSFEEVVERVSRRRSHWPSVEAFAAAYRERPPYAAWDAEVFDDYCAHALRADPQQGDWQLRCPGPVEGAVYRGQNMTGIYARAAAVDVPVTLIRARQADPAAPFDFADSPTDPQLVRHFVDADEECWREATHFFPMEQPDRLAARLRREFAAMPSPAEEES